MFCFVCDSYYFCNGQGMECYNYFYRCQVWYNFIYIKKKLKRNYGKNVIQINKCVFKFYLIKSIFVLNIIKMEFII